MTGALSCTVLVDGARVADGSPADPAGAPLVLEGLAVTWGRSTTLDQPEPASCTLTVRDEAGGDSFLGLLATGKRLDVRTDTTVYPDPTVSTITDPGFAAGGPGQALSNATLLVGGGVAVLTPGPDNTRRARVIFPPAPFAATGTNPAAWDGIPKTKAGQTWRYGATVTLPVGLAAVAAGQLHPVLFTAPWATAYTVPDTALTVPPGAAPVSGLFQPPPDRWVGLAVDVYPAGPGWDQAPGTWDAVDPALTWDGTGQTRIDDLLVLAPAAGAGKAALVFSGRITDLVASRDGTASTVAVTAQDHTAELANRDVADTPWPAQPLGVRAQRIVTLSGQPTTITVDPGPAAVTVTRQDVDAQPALGLLQDLATTADGVLWSATHLVTGQYLRLEDTHARPALMLLTMQGGAVVIVPDPAAAGTHLSACDVLEDPVTWVQDVADVSTRVAATWSEQTVAPADLIEHTETVTDSDLLQRLGVRRISVTTRLTTAVDAGKLAGAVLARTGDTGWRAQGLTWDTSLAALDPARVQAVFTLLDGTTRLGAPIILTDLPDWAPGQGAAVPLFTEGGRYTYLAGDWVLDLTVSSAKAQGASPAWDAIPAAWQWDQFDPSVTWDALTGVTPT